MRVNEIFYSIQGEGYYTGTPSVFLRLSGCNLRCTFCDTLHGHYDDLSENEIMQEIEKYGSVKHIVVTGGEPTLQLSVSLLERLHEVGKVVQIETNGTRDFRDEHCLKLIDWITCSPKFEFCQNADVVIGRIDEIKVVYDGNNDMSLYEPFCVPDVKYRCLQPCDTGDAVANREIISKTVAYCLTHPDWRLSLQTQKILKIR